MALEDLLLSEEVGNLVGEVVATCEEVDLDLSYQVDLWEETLVLDLGNRMVEVSFQVVGVEDLSFQMEVDLASSSS